MELEDCAAVGDLLTKWEVQAFFDDTFIKWVGLVKYADELVE